ncbi:uncharacterized protein BX663DRAFT_515837 [Cokeromyces recurvatus]|uniref:uncharacterized protein n=1 Tax=Cokeromyces recurvatus TaxID=90255 RepID=UPI0022206DD4|nr:uncharacterized protein BX663DRAFT_515837 [Cokeromyces recurvatus]KAI7900953.1 hypothetical protein BX663DRAFT_515837 [Cokeromyces recurvatus]
MELDEYYDIDSILAEQIKIPCIALHDYTKEANLNGNNTEVKRNTRVELPYWMAKPLAEYSLPANDSLISIELPKTYGTKVRNALDASPVLVDFRLLCPYFYLFGIKLLDLVVDDKLGGILQKAFKLRLQETMNYSRTINSSKGQEFLQKLDETEKELFRAGQDSALQFKQWRDRAVHQIKTANIGPKPSVL